MVAFTRILSLLPLAVGFFSAALADPIPGGPISDLPKIDLKNLDFTKIDLGKVDFSKIDLSKVNYKYGKFLPNKSVLELKKAITVPLAPEGAKTGEAIKNALPLVLKQYGVPNNKIGTLSKRGAALLDKSLIALLEDHDDDPDGSKRLARRGIFDDIGDFFEDVVDTIGDAIEDVVDGVGDALKKGACGIFAASTLPGYLIAASAFAIKNPSSTSWTAHQNYFISAVHGSSYRDNWRVTYNAKAPIGFNKNYGTAFGRRVYLKQNPGKFCANPGFVNSLNLILHETTHTVQYRNVNYSLERFGLEYLYKFCRAGFSYSKNAMEAQARDKADDLDNTLLSNRGMQFFRTWVAKGLVGQLGYPTAKTFSGTSSNSISELSFEKGSMQLSPNRCFRVFNKKDLDMRKAAQCTIKGPCPRRPSKPIPGIPACNQQTRNRENAACQKKKNDYARILRNKRWDCSVANNMPVCR